MTFRARLLLTFVGLLVANTVLLLVVSLETARQTLASEREDSLTAALTVAAGAFEGVAENLRRSTRRIADHASIRPVEAALPALGGSIPYTVASVAEQLPRDGVDLIRVLGGDGTLLSAYPDVERVGTRDLALASLPSLDAPGPHLRRVTLAGVTFDALLVAVRRPSGIVVVAGRLLDPTRLPEEMVHALPLVEEIRSRVDAAVVLTVGDSTFLSSPDDAPVVERVRAGHPGDDLAVARRAFLDGGITLTVVGDDALFQSIRDRLTRSAVGVAVVTLLLSWGLAWVLARSLSAPLDRFTLATRRIARGDWDEPVEAAGSVPELSTLEAAFNRMQDELRRQRDALRRAERTAAWRDAARRVAHEIKNTLTPLQLTGERLRRLSLSETAVDRELLRASADGIGTEIRGLKRLLGDFSELARWPDPDIREVNLTDLIRHTVALYDSSEERSVTTSIPDDLRLPLDAGQFTRALSNLLQNALDVSPPGSTVRVQVELEADRVTVAVSDEGPGLDAETRERMFTPYFTTKSGGTGLGLSIVERVAEAHGATVRVDSEPERGTTVALDFQIRPAGEPSSTAPAIAGETLA
jgi:signal transduction histidine kinase